jgi:hypothetical protein
MAGPTQTDHVCQLVGRLWIVEGAHWIDMMNIGVAPHFIPGATTPLTAVRIPL